MSAELRAAFEQTIREAEVTVKTDPLSAVEAYARAAGQAIDLGEWAAARACLSLTALALLTARTAVAAGAADRSVVEPRFEAIESALLRLSQKMRAAEGGSR